MPRLRMQDVGMPYKKIMKGSKWIGRVYKNAQGTWTGQIGKNASRIEVTAATDREAFVEVAARYFGHPNAMALAAHNSTVRSANRQRRITNPQGALSDLLRRLRSDPQSNPDSFLRRLDASRVARGRAMSAEDNDGRSNADLQSQVDRIRAEREVNRLEQELSEDDFLPPSGRRH
jgi:hypothetical protein